MQTVIYASSQSDTAALRAEAVAALRRGDRVSWFVGSQGARELAFNAVPSGFGSITIVSPHTAKKCTGAEAAISAGLALVPTRRAW